MYKINIFQAVFVKVDDIIYPLHIRYMCNILISSSFFYFSEETNPETIEVDRPSIGH